MPLYLYKCDDCGVEMEEFSTISKRAKTVPCSECGKPSPRSYVSSMSSKTQQTDTDRVSIAMGVHPSQIKEAMKRFPGSKYNENGHLLYTGRTEKKVRMKQRNYIEYD
ncbi:hypothetical protein LCGC14_0947060 [marine sediment metagenome]|uniref:Putative regulatory protein FmdB zinc ribbon domain-containing protein n=1 Tax=marine sediment metagenome TaxID=412755 RepID=A0A0F9P4J2_9ZZZZ